jgi:YidC/Oxa1 family membrane protein insertase
MFLGPWNGLIVHPLMALLRAIATPLQESLGFSPGVAGGLAIIIFTLGIRTVLLPLSLAQVRSSKAMMRIQPQIKELQRRHRGNREALAREQMDLYKREGVNPAAGCLPMLLQLPVLFGMYAAMLQLSTIGLTLDQVAVRSADAANGRVQYVAQRNEEPYPTGQFVLARFEVIPRTSEPIELTVPMDQVHIGYREQDLLVATQSLTLTPGQAVANVNWPNTPNGKASMFLRPAGRDLGDGTFNRNLQVEVGQPYLVEMEVFAAQTRVDSVTAVVAFPPDRASVTEPVTPTLVDLPFKSGFMGLPSLGEPDLIFVFGFGIPGVLILLMTVTSFLTTRMTAMPTEDPQQQMMMKYMGFMPLMYLFFFLATPSGLVLYWFVSNLYTMVQQYFTTGLGLFGGDLQRLTGRDFQPPWAHYGPTTSASASTNGHTDGDTTGDSESSAEGRTSVGALRGHSTQATDADRRLTANARRAASRGRKRGKR